MTLSTLNKTTEYPKMQVTHSVLFYSSFLVNELLALDITSFESPFYFNCKAALGSKSSKDNNKKGNSTNMYNVLYTHLGTG